MTRKGRRKQPKKPAAVVPQNVILLKRPNSNTSENISTSVATSSSTSSTPPILTKKTNSKTVESPLSLKKPIKSKPVVLLKKPSTNEDKQSSSNSSSLKPQVLLKQSNLKEIVLFDEQFQFHKSNAMNVLKESTNFLVIGILGKVGCGKSTLLSDLSGWDSSDFNDVSVPPFGIQTVEDRCMAKHHTNGVTMFVNTTKRVIFLDTQPLLAATTTSPPGAELKMVAWLLGVCHTLVVVGGVTNNGFPLKAVSDHQAVVNTSSSPSSAESAMTTGSVTVGQGGRGAGTADYVGASSGAGGIYRVLHTAELMLRGVPCVSTLRDDFKATHVLDTLPRQGMPATVAVNHEPRLATTVFVSNKLPYTTIESFKTAALVHGTDANENFLRLMFEQRRVLPQRTIQTINDDGSIKETSEEYVEHVMLPRRPMRRQDGGWPAYAAAIAHFRHTVMSVQRRSFVVNRFTERDWLRNASILWKTLQSSPMIDDFRATVSKTAS